MYTQSFTPIELYRCTNQIERYNSNMSKEELIKSIKVELGNSLSDGTYSFRLKESNGLYLNDHKRRTAGHLCQELVLRKLHRNIKHIYSIRQNDRNTIVKQIKLLLNEDVEMRIVRLDVKHFYDSIDRSRILSKIADDARLSYQTLSLLHSLFSNSAVATGTGLPKGLGVSADLSELYMKCFDLGFKKIEGVYYYARYVDDIIVFCSSEKSKIEALGYAVGELGKISLKLNEDKSYSLDPNQAGSEFTYLGYTFRKTGKKTEVIISQKKLNVIKTRIVKSFVRYSKDHDFEMLKLRVKYLTGNFTTYSPYTLLPVKVGVYFNYKMVNSLSALDELDVFYQRLLHCRTGRLGAAVGLAYSDMKSLEKYSFRFGFDKHVRSKFTKDQIEKITNCWK